MLIDATVKLLLARGASLNYITNFGATCLHVARRKVDIARILLENGANPDLHHSSKFTPLMEAAYWGSDDCLELLLEHNAIVDVMCSDDDDNPSKGWTALAFAVVNGTPRGVKLLAEYGADLRCHSASNCFLLVEAARREEVIAVLLEFPTRIDLNHRYPDYRGGSVLHSGVTFDTFKRLINAGADPNLSDDGGATPLSVSAYRGEKESVKYALRFGGNLNLGGPMHGAALHMACSGGQEDIVKLLLEKGAEVNTAFEDDGTPLSSLCYMDAWEDVAKAPEKIEAIARLLIESSADINKAGGKHGYPINRASHFQPARFVKFLLGQGATVDVKDEMGRCPVLFAAVSGIDNLRAILEAGGDAEACDGLQRTAVHWAAMGGHAEAFKLLLSSLPSAAVDAPDNDGWTPLCWAAYGVDPWRSNRTSERFDQAKTIRTLLEYGANRFIVAEGPVRRWTPVKITRYCRASDTVIALLEKGIDYIGPVTPETEGFVSTGARDGGSGWCVCCVSTCWGIRYKCTVCADFWLCTKCYPSRKAIHADHEFEGIGDEFVEEEKEEGQGDKGSSSDTSSPDDDSESDDEE